jgi:predicted small metal-binding protein
MKRYKLYDRRRTVMAFSILLLFRLSIKLYYLQFSQHGMLSINCRDVDVDCDYVAKGETEEELMKDAAEHAVKDHGYKEEEIMTPEMKEKIRSHIRRQ